MTRKEVRILAEAARTRLRLEHANRLAHRSNFKRHRCGALIFQNEVPVGTGWSHYSTLKLATYPLSIHAELHAILRTPERKQLFGATIYVSRYNVESGNIGLGKPCEQCQAILLEAGIKEAYYSISDNDFNLLEIGP